MKSHFTWFRAVPLFAVLFCVPLWFLAQSNPMFVELYHSRSVYILLTEIPASLSGSLKFSLVEVFYLGCSILVLAVPLYCVRRYRADGRKNVGTHVLSLGLAWTIWLVLPAFPWLLNMHRLPAIEVFGVQTPLSKEQQVTAYRNVAQRASELSVMFDKTVDGCSVWNSALPAMDASIAKAQAQSLARFQIPTVTTATGQYFLFSEFWSGLGLGGLYVAQIGQPNISQLLPQLSQPFVMAHERAHLNGFATEDSATLAAYASAFLSDNIELEYSAALRLLYNNRIIEISNAQLNTDLSCIADQLSAIEGYRVREAFWGVYDSWLRLMGQERGNKTYSYGKDLGLRFYYKYVDFK